LTSLTRDKLTRWVTTRCTHANIRITFALQGKTSAFFHAARSRAVTASEEIGAIRAPAARNGAEEMLLDARTIVFCAHPIVMT
jgi:hypothetical protein